jgi:hypothetical protein
MPTPQQHALPQQFGRFLIAGALVFTLVFWLSTSIFVSTSDAHRDTTAIRWIFVDFTTKTFSVWLADLHRDFLPFFLGQRPLVGSYLLSVPLAWIAAFLFDSKILRRENVV